jgi:serine/threonine protein kinase
MVRKKTKIFSPQTGDTYILMDRCGEGSFGIVYRALRESCGNAVAIKLVDISAMKEQKDVILREVRLNSRAFTASNGRCPKFIEVLEISSETILRKQSTIAIVTEFIDGLSLQELIAKTGTLSETFATFIIYEVSAFLKSIHAENMLHRDIKSSNILLGKDGSVYVCDFGVGRFLINSSGVASTLSGTPIYMAPEMISSDTHSFGVDIYSLGITAIEMLLGPSEEASRDYLRGGMNKTDLIQELRRGYTAPRQLDPGLFSRHIREIVEGCVLPDPQSRWCAGDVVDRIRDQYTDKPRIAHAGSGSVTSASHRCLGTLMMGSFNPKIALAQLVKLSV